MDINNHTFAICAYEQSPYLQECIDSIINQSIKSAVICTTSTPNDYINDMCTQNNIPLYINHIKGGLASDWNYAYNKAETQLITLAHQDDVYDPDFLRQTLESLRKSRKPLIAFTNYYEIRDGKAITSNRLLRTKRRMCTPWRVRPFQASRFIGRRIFMFGNPICCPSVTLVKENLHSKKEMFNTEYKVNCDFLMWVESRDLPGEFVYCPHQLMGHRIHSESETTNRIADSTRSIEDLNILRMLSPEPLAKLIYKKYIKSQSSNILRDS